MKKFILFALGIFLLGFGYSASVDLTTAEQAAKAFFKVHNYSSKPELSLTYTKYSDNAIPVFYVYNLNPTGFVIVSADDAVQPILAYSLESSFRSENMSENIEWWLNGYKSQIQYVIENNISASTETAAEWQRLLSLQPETNNGAKAVTALCSTKWGQKGSDCPLYNNETPSPGTSNSSTPTGCVATAMAQIMKYWNWPNTGIGSHSYSTSTIGGTLSASFTTESYDWTNMPNTLSCNSSLAQRKAIATLMYHCGVAVEMDYNTSANGGSGAATNSFGGYRQYCAEYAFKDFFKYKSTVHSKYRNYRNGYNASGYPINGGAYTDTEWKSLLKAELNKGRPILYSGTGGNDAHAFVCDGYDNSNKFHFNWGWSGSNNGYYTINNLTPGSFVFNSNQRAVIGIEPSENFDLRVYSNIKLRETEIAYSTGLQGTVYIANYGNESFTGSIFAIAGNENDDVFIIGTAENVTINSLGVSLFSFAKNTTWDMPPEKYVLLLCYIESGAETIDEMKIIAANIYENYDNFAFFDIVDPYEPNNTQSLAYSLPVTFLGNNASVKTTSSYLDIATDKDYYKIVLPSGYNYSISARLYDADNSENGNTYTVDAKFSYRIGTSPWSDDFDDILLNDILLSNGGTVYFYVTPYFYGETGSYLLDINITRSTITPQTIDETILNTFSVFPNPSNGLVNVVSNKTGEINVFDITGKEIYRTTIFAGETISFELNVAGMYFIKMDNKIQKLIIE